MPVLSLKDRINLLEEDLTAVPPRVSVYHDLPFAILRYDPEQEWELRGETNKLITRLSGKGKEVINISLSSLLWEAIEKSEGLEAIIELEKERGFPVAQEQVTVYLSDPDWCPLTELLTEKIHDLDRERHLIFLTGASAMAPSIYHMSRLLDEMQGKTDVIMILFYPGSIEGRRAFS
jgi:hypothetical protein